MDYILNTILNLKKIDNYLDLKNYLSSLNNINILESEDFLVITRNKDVENTTKLDYNSYFTIISKSPFRIINTFYDFVYLNNDCIKILCKSKLLNYKFDIYESLDGNLYTIFFYKDKWRFISPTNLNSDINKQIIKNTIDINLLLENLNENQIYVFKLLNSNSINIIDYSFKYGDSYNCLFHISSKLDNIYLDISNKPLSNIGIKYRDKLDDFSLLDENDKKIFTPKFKGLEIDLYIDSKYYHFQVDCKDYIYALKLKPEENKYKSYLKLYQSNLLLNHLEKYKSNKLIINMKEPFDKYNTFDVVDRSIRIISLELFELFKLVWNIADTSHRDTQLYNFLPTEYKVLLYRIKGIYFQNRQDNNLSEENEYLDINNIYNYLKVVESDLLYKIFLCRKKIKSMLEKRNVMSSINRSFKNIFLKINKIDLKKLAIFTNYLYPDVKKIEV